MIYSLPMPEGGAEHGVVFHRHHGCQHAADFRAALDDRDVDLLQFSVGLAGSGLPSGVPFVVTSSNACPVCGSQPSAWFEWKRKLIVV